LEIAGDLPQAFEPDRELGSSLGGGEFVDLVDDDVRHVGERPPEFLAGEHRLQGLGGRHEDVRRIVRLFAALVLGGVAVANVDFDLQLLAPPLQPVAHIAVERPERRDIKHRDPERVLAFDGVEHRQHRRLGLSGPRGGDHERVRPGGQRRNSPALWLGRTGPSPFGEGLSNARSEVCEGRRPAIRTGRDLAIAH